jgi:murein lipoprotein
MFMFAAAGLLILTGCESTMPTKPDVAPAPVKKVEAPQAQLSDEAKQALAQAEADIKAAQEKKALWTTAQDALKQAKEAAKKNDSAAVIKHAKQASEHAKLGIAQTQYPLTTISK